MTRLKRHKDIIFYIIFGILTTLVNIIAYWVLSYLLMWNVTISTIMAWFLAVLFAFVTNRKWVFYSSAVTMQSLVQEWVSFLICRFGTGMIDIGFMFLFVEILNYPDMIIKTAANIIVIVLNYITSKWFIFKSDNM